MATQCYAMVRGSAIRATRLTNVGRVPEPIEYAVSRSVVSVRINEVTEAGSSELLRSDQDVPRLYFKRSDELVRFKVDVSFIRCDPGVLSILAGAPVVVNAAGDVAGFDATMRVSPASFALEVWSKLANGRQPTTRPAGFGEGSFGEMPFGDVGDNFVRDGGCEVTYGYTVFPFLKGGVLSGFSFSNGLVSFTLQGAQTRRGSKWGVGPYDIDGAGARLTTPVSGNTSWRNLIVSGTPPAQADGIQQATDAINGGTATSTTGDVIDGGTATVTTSDVIDGGTAA